MIISMEIFPTDGENETKMNRRLLKCNKKIHLSANTGSDLVISLVECG